MRAVFAHDHVFGRTEEHIWSPGKLPYEAWERYLEFFPALDIIGRDGGLMESAEHWSRSDGPGVSFFLLGRHTASDVLIGVGTRARKIAQIVARSDVVIARLPSFIGFAAAQSARQMGKPLAVELVGCPLESFSTVGTTSSRLIAPFAAIRTRSAVKRANAVLYVTETVLQRRYPTRGASAACSNVMLAEVPATVLEKRMERQFAGVLGMVGTLLRYKGLEALFRAVAEVAEKGHAVRLRLLGSGDPSPWHDAAARLRISELVEFNGVRPAGAGVAGWLDDLDIYAQPSLTEGLPRALVEAMSRGLPALGSMVGGIPELLPATALHAPGDWKSLASGITRAFTDPDWRREQAVTNFNRAKDFAPAVLSRVRSRFWSDFVRYAAGSGRR